MKVEGLKEKIKEVRNKREIRKKEYVIGDGWFDIDGGKLRIVWGFQKVMGPSKQFVRLLVFFSFLSSHVGIRFSVFSFLLLSI